MPSPRWAKVLRDVTLNRTRTLLVVLSISVGVFAVGVISDSQTILAHDASERYAETRPASAALSVAGPFDNALVESVRRVPGVGDAEGRYTGMARIRRVDSTEWFQLALNVVDDYDDIRINRIRTEAGAWPPQHREILIERSSLAYMKANIGDAVEIEMPSGRKRKVAIAGAVRDPNAIPPIYSAPNVGYINWRTLEWFGEPYGFNQLLITVDGNGRDKLWIEEVSARVRGRIETESRKVSQTNLPLSPGDPPLSFVTEAMLMILGVLSVMVLLPSGFLIVNTISALLTQQVRQVGIMKAIGGRSGQINMMYLAVVALYGLLALVIPLPLSALGAHAFAGYMAEILNLDVTGASFPMETVILQVIVALVVPTLAALYPITSGTRITVKQAISSYGIGSTELGTGRIDRLFDHVRRLPRPLLLSLRNAVRRKARLALTLVPLTLGGALFIAVFSVRDSLLLSLSELSQFWKYDVAVDLHSAYPVERIEQEAVFVPGVLRAELWETTSAVRVRPDESESLAFAVVAPPASTGLVQPIIVEGRWLLPEDENAIVVNTTLLRYEPGIRVGDEIVLKIGDGKVAWRVVGLAKSGITTIPEVYVPYPYLTRVTGAPNRANSLRIVTTRHDASFQLQIMRALEERFETVGLPVSRTESSAELTERISSGMMVFVVFLMILAVLLAGVGGLGLMGTMSLNVLERTREIGVLRAIGASNRAILQIVIVESVLIGILSGLAGAVLAWPIGWAMNYETGDLLFKAPLSFAFAPSGILVWLALVALIAAAASYLPARQAMRLTVREVLAYE